MRYHASTSPFPLTAIVPRSSALELVGEQFVRRASDLDPPRCPLGLHATGGVYGVSPEVVEKALPADHAGYHRARIDADPELEAEVRDVVVRAHRLEHVERHERERASMVRAWCRNARGDHVAVPDGLDLFEPPPRRCAQSA